MKKKVLILLVVSLMFLFNFEHVMADNDSSNYNNYDPESTGMVSCGDGMVNNIPSAIPKVANIVYKVVQIAVPVVLVVLGMIDLSKSITNEKEDEIKKAQKLFVKRLIAAAFIFFVFAAVKFLISLVADGEDNKNNIIDCAECFINNDCSENV